MKKDLQKKQCKKRLPLKLSKETLRRLETAESGYVVAGRDASDQSGCAGTGNCCHLV